MSDTPELPAMADDATIAKAGATVRPTRFDYDEKHRSLLIEWSDGASHHIPFGVLRRACPCAACKGEPGYRGRFSSDPMLHPARMSSPTSRWWERTA